MFVVSVGCFKEVIAKARVRENAGFLVGAPGLYEK
jgi:hypothetical protein